MAKHYRREHSRFGILQAEIGEAVTYDDDVGSVLDLSDLRTVGLGSPNNDEKKLKLSAQFKVKRTMFFVHVRGMWEQHRVQNRLLPFNLVIFSF